MSEQMPLACLPLLQDVEQQIRMGFVRKVYALLATQLLLSLFIALPFQFMRKTTLEHCGWLLLLALGLCTGMLCAVACGGRRLLRRAPTNYLCLLALAIAMGILIGLVSSAYTWRSVALAATVTTLTLLGMTLYAWLTEVDYTGTGHYLCAALLCLSMSGLVMSLLSMCGVHVSWGMMIRDLCAALLFTWYIVYDTQLLIGGNHEEKLSIDDYCFAALSLYLDVVNVFLRILSLVGKRR